jgi:hypothetical protein
MQRVISKMQAVKHKWVNEQINLTNKLTLVINVANKLA